MPYTPDPTNASEPSDSEAVGTAAAEFRALKGRVNALALTPVFGSLTVNGASSIEGPLVFNESGADRDARFEGDTDANLLFLDASTDRVGVGTNTPVGKIDAVSNATAAYAARASTTGANQTVDALVAFNADASLYALARYSAVQHLWRYAGTTEGMRLDASGNLGVGTAAPTYRTHVAWDQAAALGVYRDLDVGSAGAAGVFMDLGARSGSVFTPGARIQGVLDNPSTTGYLLFETRNAGTVAERMRITAAGDVGIGTSSPGNKLQVVGRIGVGPLNSTSADTGIDFSDSSNTGGFSLRWLDSNGYVANISQFSGNHATTPNVMEFNNSAGYRWKTNGTERARITSGGDLLVGTTTSVGAGGITLLNNGSTGFSVINNNNAAATGYVFSSYRRSSTEIGSITQNGTTAVLFNTTSDRRLKDNIVPAPSASAVIDAIEIVSHDWKAAPDEHVAYGVIAQDLALVAPQAVLQGDDGDEIEKTWGVDYSKLVPMLIKEIQQLRARVAALEAG